MRVNVDSGFQVQLKEDGDGSMRQSWMETSGLYSVLRRSRSFKVTVHYAR